MIESASEILMVIVTAMGMTGAVKIIIDQIRQKAEIYQIEKLIDMSESIQIQDDPKDGRHVQTFAPPSLGYNFESIDRPSITDILMMDWDYDPAEHRPPESDPRKDIPAPPPAPDPRKLPSDHGSFTLTGQSASLIRTRTLSIEETGRDASLGVFKDALCNHSDVFYIEDRPEAPIPIRKYTLGEKIGTCARHSPDKTFQGDCSECILEELNNDH